MRVLVTTTSSADDRKTLAAVRALARSGAHVTVGADQTFCGPAASRYCARRIRYPNPAIDMRAFVDALRAHVAGGAYDVLLPLCDYTTMAVAGNRATFAPHVAMAVPEPESLAAAHDKLEAVALVRRLGMAVPATYAPRDAAEAGRLAAAISYPCIVKLRRGAGGVGLRIVTSPAALVACFAPPSPAASEDPVFDSRRIVQEYVPGEVYDACLVFNRGEPRAALTQRRDATLPAGGGLGILNETVEEPALRDRGVAILRALRWHGPAAVEFKRDARTGEFTFLEINARFWGTLDCAIQAGVNFPLITATIAARGDADPVTRYRVGLRYRWPLPYGLRYAFARDATWAARWRLLGPTLSTRSDLWGSDPLPHVAELLRAATRGAAA